MNFRVLLFAVMICGPAGGADVFKTDEPSPQQRALELASEIVALEKTHDSLNRELLEFGPPTKRLRLSLELIRCQGDLEKAKEEQAILKSLSGKTIAGEVRREIVIIRLGVGARVAQKRAGVLEAAMKQDANPEHALALLDARFEIKQAQAEIDLHKNSGLAGGRLQIKLLRVQADLLKEHLEAVRSRLGKTRDEREQLAFHGREKELTAKLRATESERESLEKISDNPHSPS
jgi:hypothetical protein